MTVLSPPRHPIVAQALADARVWCAGRIIDDRPALAHAARVAVTLGRHVPRATPELIAAVLLHDGPEFAPGNLDLDAHLAATYGPEVPRVVRALQAEHDGLDGPEPPMHTDDLPVLLASTSDKIVALASLVHRARRSGDTRGFFANRPALLRLLPFFRRCQYAGIGLVPVSMTADLSAVLDLVDQAVDQ